MNRKKYSNTTVAIWGLTIMAIIITLGAFIYALSMKSEHSRIVISNNGSTTTVEYSSEYSCCLIDKSGSTEKSSLVEIDNYMNDFNDVLPFSTSVGVTGGNSCVAEAIAWALPKYDKIEIVSDFEEARGEENTSDWDNLSGHYSHKDITLQLIENYEAEDLAKAVTALCKVLEYNTCSLHVYTAEGDELTTFSINNFKKESVNSTVSGNEVITYYNDYGKTDISFVMIIFVLLFDIIMALIILIIHKDNNKTKVEVTMPSELTIQPVKLEMSNSTSVLTTTSNSSN